MNIHEAIGDEMSYNYHFYYKSQGNYSELHKSYKYFKYTKILTKEK